MTSRADPSRVPDKGGFGRLYLHGELAPTWVCRWCRRLLQATPAAVVCAACDGPVGKPPWLRHDKED